MLFAKPLGTFELVSSIIKYMYSVVAITTSYVFESINGKLYTYACVYCTSDKCMFVVVVVSLPCCCVIRRMSFVCGEYKVNMKRIYTNGRFVLRKQKKTISSIAKNMTTTSQSKHFNKQFVNK